MQFRYLVEDTQTFDPRVIRIGTTNFKEPQYRTLKVGIRTRTQTSGSASCIVHCCFPNIFPAGSKFAACINIVSSPGMDRKGYCKDSD